MSNPTQTQEFIEQSLIRLNESVERIEKCLGELREEEIWKKPNDSSNAVGNLVLHLCGNITQYVISSLGGTDDMRDRDSEFTAESGFTKSELAARLRQTIDDATEIIANLEAAELTRKRMVQGFQLSGIGIIIHVVEHLSYHTGQIAFLTKLLKDKDLGFYDGANLNRLNEQKTF